MANPSKQKGTKFETLVTDYMRKFFPHAHRSAPQGSVDRGDVAGVSNLAVQCKAGSRDQLAGWLDTARAQAINGEAHHAIVVHKRRGVGAAADQFVTLSLEDFCSIYAQLLAARHDSITRR